MTDQTKPRGRRSRRLIAVTLCVVAPLVAVNTYLVDGILGWALALHCGDDTAYAPGYSESGFRRVGVGMNEDQAKALLGKPLGMRVQPSGRTSWWYTHSPNDRSYYQRAILFQDGIVVRKLHEFYVD